MLFGSLICKIRKYHKYNYYYSGICITCGDVRKEYERKQEDTETEHVEEKDSTDQSINQ
ncbi:hypothetical protein BACSP_02704 [Bacillus sp. T2.9-1]|uniref:hypothetical protein n=1 Tax=unclassified Bacillus (in: firmicutes) TaxID=185979 RepID=UPI000A68E32F|nr:MULTISPECIES: hypothetical protein [unclassified Bacillus (in: firmicutes)]CAI9390069.1 hypothetical protein BACSP_02704 [Bacillus sp. T2.9-1]